MTATTQTVTIENTGNVYEVNEHASLVDIERAEPLFFKTPHGKRETYSIYRGQLIVRNTVQFTGCKPIRRTVVYLFLYDKEQDNWFTLHTGSPNNVRQAERLIDEILDTGKRK